MNAPGAPGIRPTWTSSAKDMVGTALGPSRLWFTIGYGIVNEVYYPRVDAPQIRDLGFIVADRNGFWNEVKRNADYSLTTPGPGIPAVHILHRHPRFELSLRIAPDPERDVLLVAARLTSDPGLKLYALLAPHLTGTGLDNRAEVFVNRDRLVLCAEKDSVALALGAADAATQRDAWTRASAGYVGTSDGWQDFAAHGAMTWSYDLAGPGNVALIGELGPSESVLALGFGPEKEAAATLAISALLQPFEIAWRRHVEAWEEWHARSVDSAQCPAIEEIHVSAMVLRTHQDKSYPGAMVASLSIPWGSSSDDTGGYHLVWPRDLVESAGALLSMGAQKEARNILRYLIATQVVNGGWSQNQWLGGRPRWTGVQLDEIAFPVLLAAALAEANQLNGILVTDMVRRALGFIALNGPSTDQDRWEETPGINAFTLAVAIAALVCGAELLPHEERRDILLLADDWNAHVEDWLAATSQGFSDRYGVSRYYVRAAPARILVDPGAIEDPVPVRNHAGEFLVPASSLIATDFLQLVRFGLRRPDDPIVLDSIRLADALLKVETPRGPSWLRYNGDGYGEHEDGRPYDGSGRGRPWPLLTGERGHYALCAGKEAEALSLLAAMTAMSGRCGMIPEQVWDVESIPASNLHPGRPTGSAMPLVWAHAEFVKLAASLRHGHPVDRPEAAWLRYGGVKPQLVQAHWTRHMPIGRIPQGLPLRLILAAPALVHWGFDDWRHAADARTRPGSLGLHVVDLPTEAIANGASLRFSIQDLASGEWIEGDRVVEVFNTQS
jgi:glucoamylase